MERPSAARTPIEKGGREPSVGRGSKREPNAGGWFAAQKEEEKEDEESKRYNDTEDDDDDDGDDTSKHSCTDATLNSKQWCVGEVRKLLQRGSSDEGHGEDEGEGTGDGGVSEHSWVKTYERAPTRCNSLMLAYERGNTSDLVQGIIVRDVSI